MVLRRPANLREKAEGEFKKVEQTFAANKYVQAIVEADLLPSIGYDGNNYLERVKKLKSSIQAKLASVVNPILQDAAEQRKEGGDLVKANELYKKVLEVEPENKTALAGMEAIRAELHRRAKRMYADALLAESISELSQAKDLFAQCERTAPDNDVYKSRCKNKLSKYEVLR
jgi:tetratricopeptide (TPR) repeat protein